MGNTANSGFQNKNIRIENYPEKMEGDPHGFPTYFRCSKIDDDIEIAYFLFYPFDYKGKFCVFKLFKCVKKIEAGNHRGDWEGINVRIKGVKDYGNPDDVKNATLKYIKYTGHGMKKFIQATSPRLRTVNQTHPKVYVSWGSHTSYPEPGVLHDYKVNVHWAVPNAIEDVYDDFFLGNGLVVQSWKRLEKGKMQNVGEKEDKNNTKLKALNGWLMFKGIWGPDDNGGNASPGGPPSKSFWTSKLDNKDAKNGPHLLWEEAILPKNIKKYWAGKFQLDCSPELAGEYSPNPEYNCSFFIDIRKKCGGETSVLPSITTFNVLRKVLPKSNYRVGIFPGRYNENLVLKNKMTLQAIEGPVIIGKQ